LDLRRLKILQIHRSLPNLKSNKYQIVLEKYNAGVGEILIMKVFSLAVILFGILYIAAGAPEDETSGEPENLQGRGLVGDIVGKFANMAVGAINKVEDMLPGGAKKDKAGATKKGAAEDEEEAKE
ncbi:hypothetical protein Ocin01_09011, partial [Orchesella cincta]